MPQSNFWEQPQGAAVFKHAVIQQYAPIFANKTGSRSAGNAVTIVDGYAGRGVYLDGTPASAVLIAKTAKALGNRRNVHCWFVESSKPTYDALVVAVRGTGVAAPPRVRHAEFVDALPEILAAAKDMPLFVFVDPYGLGVPFRTLVTDLLGRNSGWPPTEVLVNMVRAGVYRNATKLHIDSQDPTQISSAAAIVDRVTDTLGDVWWKVLLDQYSDMAAFAVEVRGEYVKRVLSAAGPKWRAYITGVSDIPRGKDIYDLILFSSHEQGPWFFNEAVSRAQPVFQEHHDGPKPVLQAQLFLPEGEWITTIAANIARILANGKPVAVIDQMDAVYGNTLGYARGSHVKAAVRSLVEAGRAQANVHVDPHKLVVLPAVAVNRC